MIVRPAERSDAPAIAGIWNGYIRDSVFTFNTTEKTEDGVVADIAARQDGFFVAEEAGRVMGFATIFPFRGGPGYAHTVEHTVHLAPDARGRGTGRALMDRVEEAARRQGAHVLVAGVSGENAAGVAFHKAIGFIAAGTLPQVGRKFGRWMDLVLLQKIL